MVAWLNWSRAEQGTPPACPSSWRTAACCSSSRWGACAAQRQQGQSHLLVLILPHALLSQLLLEMDRQVLLKVSVQLHSAQVRPAASLARLSCRFTGSIWIGPDASEDR